jgi:lipid-A-disaccharide synthase
VYQPFLQSPGVSLVQHQTYNLLKVARAALVTSGTATLEAALFRVPQVVCYIANSISYAIAKRLVKVNYISLVNLILDRESVTELIQRDMEVARLKKELHRILYDEAALQAMQNDYSELASILKQGGAGEKAAEIVYRYSSGKKL